jgi:hypothetical protein
MVVKRFSQHCTGGVLGLTLVERNVVEGQFCRAEMLSNYTFGIFCVCFLSRTLPRVLFEWGAASVLSAQDQS